LCSNHDHNLPSIWANIKKILMGIMIYSLCSEFIDGCHALLSVASLTNSSLFDNLLKSIRLVIAPHFFPFLLACSFL
jgi:hypothetical protein